MIGHQTLSSEFGYGGVNCPAFRGAGSPSFKPQCINESAFEDEFRFKQVSTELNIQCRRIEFYWTSQEWGEEPSKVFDEIIRCLVYLGVDNYLVYLELRDRDSEHEQIFTKRI